MLCVFEAVCLFILHLSFYLECLSFYLLFVFSSCIFSKLYKFNAQFTMSHDIILYFISSLQVFFVSDFRLVMRVEAENKLMLCSLLFEVVGIETHGT